LRRLQPLRRFADSITPDPGSDVGRVCALESAHYMRNQLLRDADWAGMAHSVEIRVPLVDCTLIKVAAAVMPTLLPGAAKVALAHSPSIPLPADSTARVKSGFSVPIATWMAGQTGVPSASQMNFRWGLISRRWSHSVLAAFTSEASAFSR